jgi:hypothetical protein
MLRWCLDSFFSWVRCGHLLQSSENNWRSILTWTWYRHVKSQEWYPEACLNYVKLPARSLNYGYIFIYNMFLCKFLSINETLYIYNIEREKKGVCIYIYICRKPCVLCIKHCIKKKTGYLRCYSDGISLTTSQDHLGSVESQGHRRGTDAAEALGIAGTEGWRKPWWTVFCDVKHLGELILFS